MKKILPVLFSIFLLYGCENEYQPSDYVPMADSGIEDFFPDTISGFKANIKFDFFNDTCKSISATYGDNEEIKIQIILVDEQFATIKTCIKDYIMPNFENYKVKKNYNGFYAYASDDVNYLYTWEQDIYAIYIKCSSEYMEAVAIETPYIILK